jgi:hypothetical protein
MVRMLSVGLLAWVLAGPAFASVSDQTAAGRVNVSKVRGFGEYHNHYARGACAEATEETFWSREREADRRVA